MSLMCVSRRCNAKLSVLVLPALLSVSFACGAAEKNRHVDSYLSRENINTACMIGRYAGDNSRSILAPDHVVYALVKDGRAYAGPCAEYGDRRSLGEGYFQSYVQINSDGTPWAIGFEFPESTFSNPPAVQQDGLNCFDINGDGVLQVDQDVAGGIVDTDECGGGHTRVMDFPHSAKTSIAPFKWGLVNYQLHGHSPMGVYTIPHIDFHFYTQDVIERNFIRVGPCGLLINCDDMVTAQKVVPAGYVPPVFMDVGAAESRMGNHLVDFSAPEWNGAQFTETWLYGAYDGKLTFWEPMITVAYLQTHPDSCKPLNLPDLYAESGYYPTEYCIRYRAESEDFRVSLEGFVYRDAAPY